MVKNGKRDRTRQRIEVIEMYLVTCLKRIYHLIKLTRSIYSVLDFCIQLSDTKRDGTVFQSGCASINNRRGTLLLVNGAVGY